LELIIAIRLEQAMDYIEDKDAARERLVIKETD